VSISSPRWLTTSHLQSLRSGNRFHLRPARPGSHFPHIPYLAAYWSCKSASCRRHARSSQLLDYMLGTHDEGVTYRKAELKTFVSLGVEDKLAEDEIAILGSVLEFAEKDVKDIMVAYPMLLCSW